MNPNTKTFQLLKERLRSVESKLRDLVGDDPICVIMDSFPSKRKIETIEKLLYKRCCILNRMFIGTENEMNHLTRVNDHLKLLSDKLRERVKLLATSIIKDSTFDDDYEIDGTLKIPYNDESSVLSLEEDDLYGSDFRLMNSILESYYKAIGQSQIGYSLSSDYIPDNDRSYSCIDIESGVVGTLKIHHATYDLCYNKLYSWADFIRLNDFWAEAKIVAQSVTSQTGERWDFSQK